MSGARLPKIYEFPPFFTKQINTETWAAQKRHWESVVLAYCRSTNTWRLPLDSELFRNPRIQRELRPEVVTEVLDHLVANGNGEWVAGKTMVLVYVHKATTISEMLRSWAESSGNTGTVLTLYEIGSGGLAGLEDLADADPEMISRGAAALVKAGGAAPLKEDGQLVGIKLA